MRVARLNPGIFPLAPGTVQLSKALHDGKYLTLNALTGHTLVLPAAIGSQANFQIIELVAPTSNSTIVKVNNSTDVMIGSVLTSLSTGVGVNFPTAAASDTITLNRGTSGGASNGEFLEFLDIAAGFWLVSGRLNGSGVLVTPFSASV